MKASTGSLVAVLGGVVFFAAIAALAYPPAVGILGKSPNCLSCHIDNGSWVDSSDLIIDIADPKTKLSLKQSDGSFLLEAAHEQRVTVTTIIGYRKKEGRESPYRNAWLYVDPKQIDSASLTTFPTGWEVNLPMACRLVGDKSELYPDADVTVLPMTILPGKAAVDGKVTLQVMLTRGEAVKGKAKEGMIGNFFQRTLVLKVMP